MLLVVASKGLAIASPWFLKAVVDGMALASAVDLKVAFMGVGAFGATRLASSIF